MTTLEGIVRNHQVMKEGSIIQRKQFLNPRETSRGNRFNRRRFNVSL